MITMHWRRLAGDTGKTEEKSGVPAMPTAEKGFTILGGDLPSTLVKHTFLLDQVGLVYLFG